MPHIKFATQPRSIGIGRQARNISYKEDTLADWVCEVDEVLAGETPIDAAAFNSTAAANSTYNAALPPPSPPPPLPFATYTAAEIAATTPPAGKIADAKAILAKADVDITAAELKTIVLLMARYFYRKWLTGWR